MPRPDFQEIHIFLHVDSVAGLDGKLQQISTQLEKIMASLDETLAAVQSESTVDDSIIALLNGLAAQIAAGGLSPADQAKVDQIFASATANSKKVSDAVTANTPAAPTV